MMLRGRGGSEEEKEHERWEWALKIKSAFLTIFHYPSLCSSPARPWQMVLQKSGDLCFTVYDKALPVNLIFKTKIQATVDA